MPARPDLTYTHDGWQGYGHWLGTGNIVVKKEQQFLPFKKALLHARCLKLGSQKEWDTWSKSGARPANMPSTPHRTYQHTGWQGYGDWLGTGAVGDNDQQFLPLTNAMVHARSLNLKTKNEWEAWCKSGPRSLSIPSNPHRTYTNDGWQGWGHWLGTGTVAPKDQQFLPFKKALFYARSLNLKSKDDWKAWCKSGERPANIPCCPEKVYTHEGWQGYGHWLGTADVH